MTDLIKSSIEKIIENCPVKNILEEDCPLNNIRHMPIKVWLEWVRKLDEEQFRGILKKHNKCARNKEAE